MAEPIVLRIPDLGDFSDVEVIELLVRPGDEVEVDTPLITLETDKATMDVPSTAAGKVQELRVSKGSRVSAGDEFAVLAPGAGSGEPRRDEVEGEGAGAAESESKRESRDRPEDEPAPAAAPDESAPAAAGAKVTPAASRPADRPRPTARVEAPGGGLPPIEEAGFSRAHASPSVRRFARELGVDLARVTGSGLKGRITHDDVKAWVKQALAAGTGGGPGRALPAVPEVDFAAFGPVRVEELSRIQRIAGPRLHASWVNVPHVTQHDEADVTELEEVRAGLRQRVEELGIKVTPLAFIIRACARVLTRFPRFRASLHPDGRSIVFRDYCHIGFAADTPNGLVVPVIRDADRKDLYELARELAALSEKARGGRLAAADMQGGCFTVSSLGGIGGTAFTPIVNAPEVAILGVSRSQVRPVWRDGQFVPRTLLPLSLSYDHRVIDGAEAVRFTVALAEELGAPGGLLEAVP